MRAGLIFVLLSVTAGGAFRAWQRGHQERFDQIVASLVARDAVDLMHSRPAAPTDTLAGTSHSVAALPSGPHRRATAGAPLRPASMDVDQASADELVRLPGIGPSLAARIVAEREANGPFGGPDGLLRVRGIGPKTLEKIRPYLSR